MKKIVYYNLLLAILGLSFFSSCKNEVDDVFDLPSTQRMQKYIDDCNQILTSSENGWRVDYKTESGLFLNLVIKFSETGQKYGKFDMQLVNPDSVANTRQEDYIIENFEGPVLNFSTYSALARYSDPKLNGGKGQGADIEFVIRQVTPDSIVCTGRKYGDAFVLRKAIKGEINRVLLERALDSELYNNLYYFNGLGNSSNRVDVKLVDNMHLRTISTDGQTVVTELEYNDNGFDFKTPLNVGGATVTGMTWNAKKKAFEADNSMAFIPVAIPLFSLGNTVEYLRDKYFSLTDCSGSAMKDLGNIMSAVPEFVGAQFSFGEAVGDTLNFLAKNWSDEVIGNTFSMKGVDILRGDQVVFSLGYRKGEFANAINKASGKFISNFFDKKGLIVDIRDNKIYLVSVTDGRYWYEFEQGKVTW